MLSRCLSSRRRLIIFKLRRNCTLATSSFCYSTEGSKQNSSDLIYDVVISGGGMVGTAMAAALGKPTIFGSDNYRTRSAI